MGLPAAVALLALGSAPILPDLPPIPREFRAAWVATVANIDWPNKRGDSTETQRRQMLAILDKAKELNLNALVFQVRPSCDALYASKFEPWSEYLTGEQGKAPNPYWDPLAYMVQEAHKRGIQVHCWFNPYRAKHPNQKSDVAPNHIAKTNPSVVKSYGGYLWLDPGEPLVQKRSLDVMLDVVKRYDVDGVHIDDYFYPYPVKDSAGQKIPFPDDPSWSAYQRSGGKLNRDDWRRSNVDSFIERLYNGIKKEKRWVLFGISPFGIYRPGIPETIKAGVDQYAELYADCLKWYENGWCDYLAPQLYWPINQTAQAYPTLLKFWLANNPASRHLWVGNFTSRLSENAKGWSAQEILNQIALTRKSADDAGNIHFSMESLMRNSQGISAALKAGPYAMPAFVPTSPWLGGRAPASPELDAVSGGSVVFRSKCQLFALSYLVDDSWTGWESSSQTLAPSRPGATSVAIVAFDRKMNASEPLIVRL